MTSTSNDLVFAMMAERERDLRRAVLIRGDGFGERAQKRAWFALPRISFNLSRSDRGLASGSK